jgi:phage terminase large subunit-like protein
MDVANSGLTALLVIVTAIYAFLTYRILKVNRQILEQMREQLNASVRPYVVFDIVPSDQYFEGIIRNTGLTAAIRVSVNLELRIEVELGGRKLSPNLISKEIALLAPGGAIDEYFGHFEDVKKQNPSLQFSGTLTYSDVSARKYTENFVIDLSFGEERWFIAKVDVGEELKKLNEKFGEAIKLLSRR